MASRATRTAPILVGILGASLGTVPAGEVWLTYAITVSRVVGAGAGVLRVSLGGLPVQEIAVAAAGAMTPPFETRVVWLAGETIVAAMLGLLDTARVTLHYARLST